jgi:hypothetical protein
MGDWGVTKQMRNFISTPNKHIKRVLSEHFNIYDFDEFRTSIINCKTEYPMAHLKLPINDKNGEPKSTSMHPILTYKMENKRLGCINRDRNAIINIAKITTFYLKFGRFPKNFSRTTKREDIKGIQPKMKEILSEIEKKIKIHQPSHRDRQLVESKPYRHYQ